jgi:hypothetical protein
MKAFFFCRDATRLASTAIDRPLSFPRRLELRLHLLYCAGCRVYRRQIIAIDRLIRSRTAAIENDSEIHLDAEARKRIAEALRRR